MMTMIRPSSPMRKKATRTSPTLSATSAATKRLEVDPELCSGFCNRGVAQGAPDKLRGHSSAGRALAWHARGRRFDPAWLHQPSLASPASARQALSLRRLPQIPMKYVYILENHDSEHFYVGITEDLRARLAKHNAGEVTHTSKYKPWRVKTYVAFSDETGIRIREIFEVCIRPGICEEASLMLNASTASIPTSQKAAHDKRKCPRSHDRTARD